MKNKKINNFIYNLFKDLAKDEKGSILPMISVILILSIILGAVNFSLVVMYRDRAVVRNAIDAGITSSLAAEVVEKERAINYGETLVTIEEVYVKCIVREEVGEKKNGKAKYRKVDNSFYAPRIQHWVNDESDIKNYIQLDVEKANSVAKEYFEKNMKGNSLNYSIRSWEYNVTYDDKRIYTVKKNRKVTPNRQELVKGRKPSGNCNAGKPDIYNKVTNPETWWISEFANANTGSWKFPPEWTNAITEEREVIFPRWVEVKANVTVELPVPLGKLVGKETYKANFNITAFKELVDVIQ